MDAAVATATAPWPDRLKFSPLPMPTLSASRWRFLDSPADTIAYLHQQRALSRERPELAPDYGVAVTLEPRTTSG